MIDADCGDRAGKLVLRWSINYPLAKLDRFYSGKLTSRIEGRRTLIYFPVNETEWMRTPLI
jgi:hypothetical protein